MTPPEEMGFATRKPEETGSAAPKVPKSNYAGRKSNYAGRKSKSVTLEFRFWGSENEK